MCAHADKCGGCALMHVDYKGQVRMKEAVLKEALKKYAHYTGPIEPLIKNPDPLAYRNACKLPFDKEEGKIVTGLYQKDTTDFIPVERCLIHQKGLEAARRQIAQLAQKYDLPVFAKDKEGLMTLVLKEFDGKVHTVFVTTDIKLPEEFINDILHMENTGSVWQSIKEKGDPDYELFGSKMLHLGGEMDIVLQSGNFTLNMLPRSFFQLNTKQAQNLYSIIASWIPKHSSLLVEAYSGIGAISLYAADKADKVIGIETIEDAVINARQNALLNGKDNLEFICGDAAKELKEIAKTNRIDTLVVDPPRSGLNDDMIAAVLKSRPETFIYVSCNPATLAKNLEKLQHAYAIEKVQPFDFFSQTPHVETAVLLKLASQKQIEEYEKKCRQADTHFRKPASQYRKPAGFDGKRKDFKSHKTGYRKPQR